MPERWMRELHRLRRLELPERVWERAQQGPTQTLEPSAPRRLVAAGVAVALFIGAAALAWMALRPLAERPTPSDRPTEAIDPARSILWSVRDKILLVDPVTGRYRTLIRLPDPGYPDAIWAPGHQAIAYRAGRYGKQGWALLDLSTRKRTRLLRTETLAWSPDGTKIAYASRVGVTIARASDLAPLTEVEVPPLTGVGQMAWAPGPDPIFKGLGFVRNPSGTVSSGGPTFIYLVDPASGTVSRVTETPDPSRPKWTTDGSRILFVRYYTGRIAAWTIRPDGTDLTPLPNSRHALAADFSPDGEWIAIVKWVGPAPVHMRLWVMRPDGSDARPIGPAIPGDDASVDW